MSGRDAELARDLERLPVPDHRPGFWDDVRAAVAAPAPARRRLRLPRLRWLAPAAALVCAVVAFALVGLSTDAETATAADVRRAVERALGSIDRIGGVLVVRESSGETRWRFTLDADGDFSARALAQPVTFAYSAAEGVERNLDTGNLTERAGVAPGPPDSQSPAWMVQRGLGSVVRALAASGVAVEELEHDGRDAWLLRTHTQNHGETREVTVDRATGLPVRDVIRRRGAVALEWRIDGLTVGGQPPATLARRGGEGVTRWDNGFRRVGLEGAAAAVGYAPVVPTWLPDGYRLAEVAVARRSRPTGNEQHRNPPSRDVVSALYRHGFDQVVVTTRRVGSHPSAWSDPVAIGDLSRPPASVVLTHGSLSGTRVEVVVDPNAPVHLWGISGGLVLTVTGDLDRLALLRVAHSLAPFS